jgi:hypothetical protein
MFKDFKGDPKVEAMLLDEQKRIEELSQSHEDLATKLQADDKLSLTDIQAVVKSPDVSKLQKNLGCDESRALRLMAKKPLVTQLMTQMSELRRMTGLNAKILFLLLLLLIFYFINY